MMMSQPPHWAQAEAGSISGWRGRASMRLKGVSTAVATIAVTAAT